MKTVMFMLMPLVSLGFVSCSVTYITVRKPLPPEIVPEKGTNKVAFVNFYDYSNDLNVAQKKEEAYLAGLNGLIEGLKQNFAKDDAFRFMVGDRLRKSFDRGHQTVVLPADSTIHLCRLFQADLLMTLDSMLAFYDTETYVTQNEDGSKSKTKNIFLNFKAFISLYAADGQLINRSEVARSSLYTTRPTLSGLITIQPSMAKAAPVVSQLAVQVGEEYVKKFYPQIVDETRMLYKGKIFAQANHSFFINECGKAEELLQQLTQSPDKKIAGRAENNLSVVQEGCSRVVAAGGF